MARLTPEQREKIKAAIAAKMVQLESRSPAPVVQPEPVVSESTGVSQFSPERVQVVQKPESRLSLLADAAERVMSGETVRPVEDVSAIENALGRIGSKLSFGALSRLEEPKYVGSDSRYQVQDVPGGGYTQDQLEYLKEKGLPYASRNTMERLVDTATVPHGTEQVRTAQPTRFDQYPTTSKLADLAAFVPQVAMTGGALAKIGVAGAGKLISNPAASEAVKWAVSNAAEMTGRKAVGTAQDMTWGDIAKSSIESGIMGGGFSKLGAIGVKLGDKFGPRGKLATQIGVQSVGFGGISEGLRKVHGIPTETSDIVIDFLVPVAFELPNFPAALKRKGYERIEDAPREVLRDVATETLREEPEWIRQTLEMLPESKQDEFVAEFQKPPVDAQGKPLQRLNASTLPVPTKRQMDIGDGIQTLRNLGDLNSAEPVQNKRPPEEGAAPVSVAPDKPVAPKAPARVFTIEQWKKSVTDGISKNPQFADNIRTEEGRAKTIALIHKQHPEHSPQQIAKFIDEWVGSATPASHNPFERGRQMEVKPTVKESSPVQPRVVYKGTQEGFGDTPSFKLYNLEGLPEDHPLYRSTVTEQKLKEHGFDTLPREGEPVAKGEPVNPRVTAEQEYTRLREEIGKRSLMPKKWADAIVEVIRIFDEQGAKRRGVSVDDFIAERPSLSFDKGDPQKEAELAQQLGREVKGSIEPRRFLESGKALIRAYSGADFSTLAHETAHFYRQVFPFTPDEIKAIESLSKAKRTLYKYKETSEKDWKKRRSRIVAEEGVVWDSAAEEWFARAFEKYLWTGEAPTPTLTRLFSEMRTFMREVYNKAKMGELGIRLDPRIKATFDGMFGKDTSEFWEYQRKLSREKADNFVYNMQKGHVIPILRTHDENGRPYPYGTEIIEALAGTKSARRLSKTKGIPVSSYLEGLTRDEERYGSKAFDNPMDIDEVFNDIVSEARGLKGEETISRRYSDEDSYDDWAERNPEKARKYEEEQKRLNQKSTLKQDEESSPPDEDLPFQLGDKLRESPFYLKSARIIESKFPNRLTADVARKTLLNNGVKPEEMKWVLDDLLDSAGDRVLTKQEILQHIAENKAVQIEDVTKGAASQEARDAKKKSDLAEKTLREHRINQANAKLALVDYLKEKYGTSNVGNYDAANEIENGESIRAVLRGMGADKDEKAISYATKLRELVDDEKKVMEAAHAAASDLRTLVPEQPKFSSHKSIPGGENYRELVITLPNLGGRKFTVPQHWGNIKNPVAHIRMDDRVDAEGNRVLFIHEMQSDWNREGREKGFGLTQEKIDEARNRLVEIERELGNAEVAVIKKERDIQKKAEKLFPDRYAQGSLYEKRWYSDIKEAVTYKGDLLSKFGKQLVENLGEDFKELSELQRKSNSLNDEYVSLKDKLGNESFGVPDAPFVRKWQELVAKKVVEEAASGGYDRIAWATGEQVANMFDLRKHFDSVDYVSYPDGRIWIGGVKDGNHIVRKESPSIEQLPNIIGKNAAEAIQNDINKKSKSGEYRKVGQGGEIEGSIYGDNLVIGGEWATNLYDREFPQIFNKIGKRFGAKSGESFVSKSPEVESITVKQSSNGWGYTVTYTDGQKTFHLVGKKKAAEKAANTFFYQSDKVAVNSLPITPEMRRAILSEGQELFQTGDSENDKLYHGTSKRNASSIIKQQRFDSGKIGTGADSKQSTLFGLNLTAYSGNGFYFSRSPHVAKTYADFVGTRKTGGEVLEVSVNGRLFDASDKKKTVEKIRDWWKSDVEASRRKKGLSKHANLDSAFEAEVVNASHKAQAEAINSYAKANGYVGVHHVGETVVFDGSSIKEIKKHDSGDVLFQTGDDLFKGDDAKRKMPTGKIQKDTRSTSDIKTGLEQSLAKVLAKKKQADSILSLEPNNQKALKQSRDAKIEADKIRKQIAELDNDIFNPTKEDENQGALFQTGGKVADPNKLDIVKRGGTVGFDKDGNAVTVEYSSKIMGWRVHVWREVSGAQIPIHDKTKVFSTKQEAAKYAASMLDYDQTMVNKNNDWLNPRKDLFSDKINSSSQGKLFVGVPDPESIARTAKWLAKPASVLAKTTNRGLSNSLARLEKSESGKEFVQKTITAETRAKMMTGDLHSTLDTDQRKLTKQDIELLNGFDDIEKGRANSIALIENLGKEGVMNKIPSERIKKFAWSFKKVTDKIADKAEEIGVKVVVDGSEQDFKRIESYFPHWMTRAAHDAVISQEGKVWDAMLEKLRKQSGNDEAEYQNRLLQLKKYAEGDIDIHREGSLEKPRLSFLPDYVTVDGKRVKILESNVFDVADDMIERHSRRLSIIEQFGQGDKQFNEYYRKLYKEDPALAYDFKNFVAPVMQGLRVDRYNPKSIIANVYKPVSALVNKGLLSAAVLSQVGGVVAIPMQFGVRRTAGAVAQLLKAHQTGELQEMRRLRGFYTDILKILGETDAFTREGFEGVDGNIAQRGLRKANRAADAYLRNTLGRADRILNDITSLTAVRSVEDALIAIKRNDSNLLKKGWGTDANGQRRMLKRFFQFTDAQIDEMVQRGKLTDEERARIVQRAPASTNAAGQSVLDRPAWMHKDIAKHLFAFSSYVQAIGRYAAWAVKEASQHGNMRPIIGVLVGGAISGEIEIGVKNWFNDREREEKNFAERLYNDLVRAGILGLAGSIYQSIDYSLRAGANPIAEQLSPPPLDALAQLGKAIYKAGGEKSLAPIYYDSFLRSIPAAMIANTWGERAILGDKTASSRRLIRENMLTNVGKGTTETGKPKLKLIPRKGRENTGKMLLDRASIPQVESLYRREQVKRSLKRKEAEARQ